MWNRGEKMKKRTGKLLGILVALAVSITGNQVATLDVAAGSSNLVVDSTSFKEELSATKWNAPNGDVTAKGGKIIFSKNSTAETRLIARDAAKATEYFDELFRTEYTLTLKSLPKDQRFFVAYSLNNAESYYEEAGNLELVFTNDGGVKVALRAIDDSGNEVILAKAQNVGISLGRSFTISVQATNKMNVNVKVNNKSLYNKKAPVDLEGRMGFLQTGSCEAEIEKVEIVSHSYDRPENTNISEDFESGSMNKNALTSIMTRDLGFAPSGIFVEEYNGSKVLMFRNVAQGFFGTKHQFSNFEVSFDVPFIQRKDVVSENGDIQSLAHGNFVLGIGDESDVYSNYGYQTSGEGIVFAPDRISSFKTEGNVVDLPGKGYYDPEKNESYSVKVTVIDTQITVYVKALKATKYDKVLDYKVADSTPLGFVHIWSSGLSNFAIDNFKLVNKDKDANVLDLEYEASAIVPEEDWVYEPMEVVYLEDVLAEKEDKSETFNWAMILVYAAAAGVVIVVVCAIIAAAKRKAKTKKEEVSVDEN